MYKLIYARTAVTDLDAIFNYIAKDSRENAVNYFSKLEKTIKQLEEFPNLGIFSRYPELNAQKIKMLPHDKYLIFYKFDGETVYIIRVLHGAMNYKNLF